MSRLILPLVALTMLVVGGSFSISIEENHEEVAYNISQTDANETDVNETDVSETDVNETGFNETGFNETVFNETSFNETGFNETDVNETDATIEPDEETMIVSLDWSNRGLTELASGFLEMESLTNLTLDNNEIAEISSEAFSSTPNLTRVSLVGNKLRNLTLEPFSRLENLEFLNLTRSSDKSLSPYDATEPWTCSLEFPRLTHLSLDDNALEQPTIAGGKFPALTHLFLSENLLDFDAEIWSKLAANAPEIGVLRLGGNAMVGFDASLFKNLTILRLKNNFIEKICLETCSTVSLVLEGCSGLRILDLSSNLIAVIDEDAFDDAGQLEELDLSDNAIENLTPGIFDNLQQLRKLSLQGNEIVDLMGTWLIGSPNQLAVLRLDNNRLLSLGPETFSNLTNLNELTLNNNEISSVEPETFSNLNKLEKLSIAGNLLTRILPGTLPTSIALTALDLSYNRFNDTAHISLGNSSQVRILNAMGNPWTKTEPFAMLNATNELGSIP